MFKVKQFISVIKIDNILDSYRDKLEFPINRDWFKKVICKQKERLINNSEVINNTINIIDDIIREAVEIAITVLLEQVSAQLSYKEKSFNMKKKLDSFDVIKFDRIFREEMTAMNVMNHPRLWSVMGVSYGQGMERGLSDLGKSPEQLPWHEFRETKAYQQKLWGTLKHITNGLSDRVRGVVAVGVADGLSPYMIARRLRDIKLGPKKVFVNPKIVDGVQVRKGYSYIISDKRYAEMIARTESARALTEGRVGAYRRGGIKQVQWLSAGDSRVCEECMDLDGRIFPINAAPMVPLHISCRCDKVSAGLTEPVKVQEVTEGEKIYANSFTKDYTKNSALLKSDLTTFKTDYRALTTIQRKQFLRQTLNQYNSVGIVPKVAHSNLDDIGMMVLQSKKLELLQARQKAFLKLGMGEKKSLLFIGDKKVKVLNNFISSNGKSIINEITRVSKYNTDLGGLTFSAKRSINLFQKGKSLNVIYMPKSKVIFPQFGSEMYYGNIKGHNLIHEIGHTIYNNKNILDLKINGTSLYKIANYTGTKFPTVYASSNPSEAFSEFIASKYSGTYKLDSGTINFLDKLEDKLLLK